MKGRLLPTASGTLVVLGAVALLIEQRFYGDIDADGFLQESLFLPLGAIALIIGVAGLFVQFVIWMIRCRST